MAYKRSTIFFGNVTGASTFSDSVDETGIATDAPSAIETGLASVAESGTAADVTNFGGLVQSALVAETGNAIDTPSLPRRAYISWAQLQTSLPRPPLSASVAETASAVSITSSSGGGTASVVAESASAVDHVSATGGSTNAILAELGTAVDSSDSFTALRVYLAWADIQLPVSTAPTAETGAATDAPLAVALRVASRAEVGAVLDAPLGQVDYRPAVLEALAAAEFQSAIGGASPVAQVENLVLADDSDGIGGITPVVIAEIGVALDTPTGAAQLFSVAAESLSAADTLDGTDSASMFESLVANDVPDAVMITSGSIAEGTASAQDVATAAAVWEMAVAETAAAADFQIPVVMIPPVFETEPRSNITLRPKGARLGTPVIQPQDSSLG